jgi:prepilin-type processing-associated H-X9-DG protein
MSFFKACSKERGARLDQDSFFYCKIFTLIELLVSILLPALNKAKGRARGIACFSNLKNLGKLAALYQSDNSGYLMLSSNHHVWMRAAFKDYLWSSGNDCNKGQNHIGWCPSGEGGVGYNLDGTYLNYANNWYFDEAQGPKKLSGNSAKIPLFGDASNAYYHFYPDSEDHLLNRLSYRHDNGVNLLFGDSHVERKKIDFDHSQLENY